MVRTKTFFLFIVILLKLNILLALYPNKLQNWYFDDAKAPWFDDRKSVHINLIWTDLRSSNRGSFRICPNTNSATCLGINEHASNTKEAGHQSHWGNLIFEGHEIDLKAAELAEKKLLGGHYDEHIHAVVPTDFLQMEKEWKKVKNHIAQIIGPIPSVTTEDKKKIAWKNSATTPEELLQDAYNLSASFKTDFQYIAKQTRSVAFFGLGDCNLLKTYNSLVSKIERDIGNLHITKKESIAQIGDALRGTIIVEDLAQIPEIIAEIISYVDYKDGQVIFKNLWEENRESGYVGIHAKMILPVPNNEETAKQRYLLTEMQIHFHAIVDGTDESVKERAHLIYQQVQLEDFKHLELSAASKLLFLTAMEDMLNSLKKEKESK